MELLLDKETFPERNIQAVPATEIDKNQFARYVDKAEQKYTWENGVRVVHLDEVVITAQQKPPRKSSYYSTPNNSITEEELEKFPLTDVRSLLMRILGVLVTDTTVSIRRQEEPLLIVDDTPMDIEYLDMISVFVNELNFAPKN